MSADMWVGVGLAVLSTVLIGVFWVTAIRLLNLVDQHIDAPRTAAAPAGPPRRRPDE